jgi:2-methylcitrate dehydratase PrpD
LNRSVFRANKIVMSNSGALLISERLAQFASSLRYEDIPAAVRERAKYLVLDAVGIALASSRQPFAQAALAGLASFGTGDAIIIGIRDRLPLRDAMIMNGVLVHGLDYDDTHMEGVVHTSASCFPCSFGVAAQLGGGGKDFLTAFVLGTEVAARLGMVAKGALHQAGFHPTGMLAPFACALIAGKLYGLDAEKIVMAQGIALSTGSSSSRQFNPEAAASKRLHPGWGAAAGVTAAALAQHGFTGPRAAYEGDYGLYPAHLGARFEQCNLDAATAGLGHDWETLNVAIKPIPACHLVHACADAAAAISRAHPIKPSDITSIRALVPAEAIQVVCEPVEQRRRPATGYAAQFSIFYAVASGLARGRFSLHELEPAAIADPEILALAQKVEYKADPKSEYPRYFSGEVIVKTKHGHEYSQREHINRGAPARPLSSQDIVRKFMDNASLAVTASVASGIVEAVSRIESCERIISLGELLREAVLDAAAVVPHRAA